MNDIAISLKNVSKYYKLYNSPQDRLKESLSFSDKIYHKKFYATRNLNLEIKKGEILGIVGKNGSGKSSLLKLITGVLTPDEGSVKINGKISALLELGSGFNPEFTGMQNIFFYGTILGFSRQEMEEKLDDIIAFADIGEFIDQPLKTYSSGMKSRLGFAVAVHIDPEILILDEVLAVGDILFKRKCYAKMEEFFKSGKTILFVSHDANSVNELCTRAIFLDSGQILMDDEAQTVTKYYQKYMFAKQDTLSEVRNEILNYKKNNAGTAQTVLNTKHQNEEKKLSEAYFISNFISKNQLAYSDYDVEIIEPIMIDTSGQQVNVLVHDKTYLLGLKVKFSDAQSGVSFGMRIKTIKGIYVSGAALHIGDKNIEVESQDYYSIEWKFKCKLLAGTYVIDLGVSSMLNGARCIISWSADAYMFKVLPKQGSINDGLVSLDQNINIQKLEDE